MWRLCARTPLIVTPFRPITNLEYLVRLLRTERNSAATDSLWSVCRFASWRERDSNSPLLRSVFSIRHWRPQSWNDHLCGKAFCYVYIEINLHGITNVYILLANEMSAVEMKFRVNPRLSVTDGNTKGPAGICVVCGGLPGTWLFAFTGDSAGIKNAPSIPVAVTTRTPSAATPLQVQMKMVTQSHFCRLNRFRAVDVFFVPELTNARRELNALKFLHIIGDIFLVGNQRYLTAVVKECGPNYVFTRKTNAIQLGPVRNEILFLYPNLYVARYVTDQQVFAQYVPFEHRNRELVRCNPVCVKRISITNRHGQLVRRCQCIDLLVGKPWRIQVGYIDVESPRGVCRIGYFGGCCIGDNVACGYSALGR